MLHLSPNAWVPPTYSKCKLMKWRLRAHGNSGAVQSSRLVITEAPGVHNTECWQKYFRTHLNRWSQVSAALSCMALSMKRCLYPAACQLALQAVPPQNGGNLPRWLVQDRGVALPLFELDKHRKAWRWISGGEQRAGFQVPVYEILW